MQFNKHSNLKGMHSFLGASKYHWTNYSDEKLIEVYKNSAAAQRGSELHELAADLIRLGVKLARSNKTLNLFVNDAIGYRMAAEQILFYSPNCFGTADAIKFDGKLLRIHDLKTGATPTSIRQLEVYAAMFCLEYMVEPEDIKMELRIYQEDEVLVAEPTAEAIRAYCQKIVHFDRLIEDLKMEMGE